MPVRVVRDTRSLADRMFEEMMASGRLKSALDEMHARSIIYGEAVMMIDGRYGIVRDQARRPDPFAHYNNRNPMLDYLRHA